MQLCNVFTLHGWVNAQDKWIYFLYSYCFKRHDCYCSKLLGFLSFTCNDSSGTYIKQGSRAWINSGIETGQRYNRPFHLAVILSKYWSSKHNLLPVSLCCWWISGGFFAWWLAARHFQSPIVGIAKFVIDLYLYFLITI